MTTPPLPRRVTIVEVGPRDGLQNERVTLSAADKASFIDRLTAAGLPVIEAAAFVSPKWVPQMADAGDVCARIVRRAGVRYTGLVPNLQGLTRAMDAGLREVAVFGAASETFSRRNINQTIDESFAQFAKVCDEAALRGVKVRGYLSTCFGCPFEGDVPASRVVDLTARLLDFGVFEVSIGDTIGVAHPGQVRRVLDALLDRSPATSLALHFHDTRGMALANVLVGLEAGVATFDSSAGGLGGCPYAPGATGNLATEDLIYMLDGLGIETGVNLDALLDASRFLEPLLDHPLPSKYYRASRAAARLGRADL